MGSGPGGPGRDDIKATPQPRSPPEVPTAPKRPSRPTLLPFLSTETPPKPEWTGELSDPSDTDASDDDSDDLELSNYEPTSSESEPDEDTKPDVEDRLQPDQQQPDFSGLAEFPARPVQRSQIHSCTAISFQQPRM